MHRLLQLLFPLVAAIALFMLPVFVDRVEGTELGASAVVYSGGDLVGQISDCILGGRSDRSVGSCAVGGGMGFWVLASLSFLGLSFLIAIVSFWSAQPASIALEKATMGLTFASLIGFIFTASFQPEGVLNGPGIGVWLVLMSAILFISLNLTKKSEPILRE